MTASALIILCLSIITWTQVGYWQDSITLYDHTLKVTDYNWLTYYNRGHEYNDQGNYKQALEDFNRAIEINPGYDKAYINRGFAHQGLGNYRQAIEDHGRSIEIDPSHEEAYYNLVLSITVSAITSKRLRITTGQSKSTRVLQGRILTGAVFI